jgi:hypothetical protein
MRVHCAISPEEYGWVLGEWSLLKRLAVVYFGRNDLFDFCWSREQFDR